jgi:hypothetical protein
MFSIEVQCLDSPPEYSNRPGTMASMLLLEGPEKARARSSDVSEIEYGTWWQIEGLPLPAVEK